MPASFPLPRSMVLGFHFYGSGNMGDDLMVAGFLQAMKELFPGRLPVLAATSEFDLQSQRIRFPEMEWIARKWLRPVLRDREFDLWAGVGDTPFQLIGGTGYLDFLHSEMENTPKIPRRVMICVGAESDIGAEIGRFSTLASKFDRISCRDAHSHQIIVERLGFDKSRARSAGDLANVSLERLFPAGGQARDFSLGLVVAGDTLGAADLEAIRDALKERSAGTALIAGDVRNRPELERGIYKRWRGGPFNALRRRTDCLTPRYATCTLAELARPIARCQTLVSSRYHGLLTAAWAGCRVGAIARSSKVTALARQLQIPMIVPPLNKRAVSELFEIAAPVNRAILQGQRAMAQSGVLFALEGGNGRCN